MAINKNHKKLNWQLLFCHAATVLCAFWFATALLGADAILPDLIRLVCFGASLPWGIPLTIGFLVALTGQQFK